MKPHALNWFFICSHFSRQQVNNWSMTKENHDPANMSVNSPSSKAASRLVQQRSLEKTHHSPQHEEPQTAKLKSSSDLFELLERCQSQRLDDQRCVLPSYFSQVSWNWLIFLIWSCLRRRPTATIYNQTMSESIKQSRARFTRRRVKRWRHSLDVSLSQHFILLATISTTLSCSREQRKEKFPKKNRLSRLETPDWLNHLESVIRDYLFIHSKVTFKGAFVVLLRIGSYRVVEQVAFYRTGWAHSGANS